MSPKTKMFEIHCNDVILPVLSAVLPEVPVDWGEVGARRKAISLVDVSTRSDFLLTLWVWVIPSLTSLLASYSLTLGQPALLWCSFWIRIVGPGNDALLRTHSSFCPAWALGWHGITSDHQALPLSDEKSFTSFIFSPWSSRKLLMGFPWDWEKLQAFWL